MRADSRKFLIVMSRRKLLGEIDAEFVRNLKVLVDFEVRGSLNIGKPIFFIVHKNKIKIKKFKQSPMLILFRT